MEPELKLDDTVDAGYVRLSLEAVARTRELDPQRIVDYDVHGEIVGIEFLDVHHGVDLHGLPQHDKLARLFGDRRIPIYA